MKARTKFIKMFRKLPEGARKRLVYDSYGNNPMSLNIIYMEVKDKTLLGMGCLSALGYTDDACQEDSD